MTFGVETFHGATVNFTASVSSGYSDPNPGDNTATETTTVAAAGRDIVVTNTNDSGPGSLRAALDLSDQDEGDVDRIVFNIPGSGVKTISVLTDLSANEPVIIDGRTQPGFSGTPLIALTANGAFTGLNLQNGSTARGLAFGGFQRAVVLNGNINLLEGNYIGVSPNGTTATPNQNGVEVFGKGQRDRGNECAVAERHFREYVSDGIRISAPSNVVIGNYIGTNAAGTADLGNGSTASRSDWSSSPAAPASTTSAVRRPRSGTLSPATTIWDSLEAGTSANLVQGNYIGTNAAGSAAITNATAGIQISNSGNNGIGGSKPARATSSRATAAAVSCCSEATPTTSWGT